MTEEITRKTKLCSATGGVLDVVDADGEILAEIAVPAGVVSAQQYFGLVPEGCHLEIASGVAAINPRHRIGIQQHAGHRESGANPDFVPTSSSRFEREMRLTLNRMQAATKRVEAREKQLASIQRVPTAPEVVETVVETVAEEGEGTVEQ